MADLVRQGRLRRPRRGTVAVVALVLTVVLVGGVAAGLGMGGDSEPAPASGRDEAVREFLAPWYDAVEQQQMSPARMVVVGDSISEGAGMPSPVYANRFVGMLQTELRQLQGAPPGAVGYLPAYYADVLTADDTVRTGPPAQEYMFEKWGLGGRALFMPGGSSLTYPALEARKIRVWYGALDFLAGQAKVRVDGVDVTDRGHLGGASGSVSASPATIVGAGEEPAAGLWWESSDLGPGEHVVQVSSLAPGSVFVHTGVEFLDPDAETGIHVYDGSHAGATTQHYVSDQMIAGHWAEVAALDPRLIVVNLGTNPDPEYRANLERLVEIALEAAPRAQVLLVDGYEPGIWQSSEWDEVQRARQEVAELHPERVAVFDLAAHWPELAKDGSTNEGLMLEESIPLHPSVEGNRRMAEIFAELLDPAGRGD